MNAQRLLAGPIAQVRAVVLVLALAAMGSVSLSWAAAAADPSPEPAVPASQGLEVAGQAALCESAANLRLIVGFLRETSISEDGVIPVVVGAIAGVSEARTLAGIVSETYRPLAEDLVSSLQGLRTAVDERAAQPTLGAQIASIGEAIAAVGTAMDALSVQLQTPCPVEDPASSAGE